MDDFAPHVELSTFLGIVQQYPASCLTFVAAKRVPVREEEVANLVFQEDHITRVICIFTHSLSRLSNHPREHWVLEPVPLWKPFLHTTIVRGRFPPGHGCDFGEKAPMVMRLEELANSDAMHVHVIVLEVDNGLRAN